ncbi:MAG: phosphoribosylaminoimidazolesuccinocarboxamide synthase [Bacteroidia bacterium]|nr:phosphoribosylaminoimidazolesuccinocarboxamide synthase [Bacteroidia bacterium]
MLRFSSQTGFYQGKVRDIYSIGEDYLVIVSTNRISAFDHILRQEIPYKGQVLNQIAAYFLEQTKEIVPNHYLGSPVPNVTVAVRCEPFPIEVVVRAYLAGHAWREYKLGKRTLSGVPLPEGMRQNDKFPEPIITPTTKSKIGHDIDISAEEIIKSGLVEDFEWAQIQDYALKLFEKGTQMAQERGLILVDTKYEFGVDKKGNILLIDEVHTPDSSRYFMAQSYYERQAQGLPQVQLSKEFVREWLIKHGFQGLEGQTLPDLPPQFVQEVSKRYIELYELLTGKTFIPQDYSESQIQSAVEAFLSTL